MILKRKFPLYSNKLKDKACWLRKNSPLAEVILWNKLKGKQLLNYKFQKQKPIGKYIVDFYCEKLKLILEIDGFSHNFKINYDKLRDRHLKEAGFSVLHFADTDILKKISNIIQIIVDWIYANTQLQPTPPYPPPRGDRKKLKLAVLSSTRGTDMQAIIEAIKRKELNASIDVVISNKSDAYILERAKNNGLEAIFVSQKDKTREQFDEDVSKILEEKKVDLILLIGYMRILSTPFVRKYKNRILNVHPSLLPAFAGGMDLNVHEEVIKAGIKETGCTIHYVDEGVDTGKIILQKKCPVLSTDTPETLKEKVQKLEGEAWVEVIRKFIKL